MVSSDWLSVAQALSAFTVTTSFTEHQTTEHHGPARWHNIKVMDFGIAGAKGKDSSLTTDNSVLAFIITFLQAKYRQALWDNHRYLFLGIVMYEGCNWPRSLLVTTLSALL